MVKSPACSVCGLEWFYHGGMPHDFEHPSAPTAPESIPVIDWKARAEKAEAELRSLYEMYRCAFCQQTEAFEGRAEKAEAKYAELRATSIEKLRMEESARAEKAEARLAELVGEVVDWMALPETDQLVAPWKKLVGILNKYEGGEHG